MEATKYSPLEKRGVNMLLPLKRGEPTCFPLWKRGSEGDLGLSGRNLPQPLFYKEGGELVGLFCKEESRYVSPFGKGGVRGIWG
jgi:hypothetical protein